MEIGPNNKVDNAARLRPTPAEQPEKAPARTSDRPRGDSVELSRDSRGQIGEAADLARSEEYSEQGLRGKVRARRDDIEASRLQGDGDRLEAIRDRIESGYYEQPDIKRQIAGRLADALMPPDDAESEL